jgi:hypothetical protein
MPDMSDSDLTGALQGCLGVGMYVGYNKASRSFMMTVFSTAGGIFDDFSTSARRSAD